MSKKHINTVVIENELREGSVFFQKPSSTPAGGQASEPASTKAIAAANKPASLGTDAVSKQPDSKATSLIERIRKAVKPVGREVSFIRMSREEKQRLEEVVYGFKHEGIKTTETEINRIAVNMLLEDFQARGKESVLAQVIDALLA